ncbi:conserved protein of unknown function [Magnetospirillum sp. XM-1]|nr:conserved protein of unknown function [Magnetospirillum sp. XM-1]
MRIVAVNHHHPDAPVIGAVRVARFAAALAELGHRVVLLTGALDPTEPPADPAHVAAALAVHDWRQPFLLACPSRPLPLLAAARNGGLPRPLRRLVLAGHYLRHGGVFTDWREGSAAYWPLLAEVFRPEVTWGTFGNTDAWSIARGIAALSRCPWVMDIKDVWEAFVPRPVSGLVARRFADAAACTGLSQGHLDNSGRHFRLPKTAIYSGIPEELLTPAPPSLPFRITVTGSSYGWLDGMMAGIGRFLDHLPDDARREIVFTYAGGEHELVRREAAALKGRCGLDIRPFIALGDLAGLQRQAFLNLYGRMVGQPGWFHHKVFELLAADRPIAAFPTETAEAVDIAATCGGDLSLCPDSEALAQALERTWRGRTAQGTGVDRGVLAGYTWAAQAVKLEAVLTRAAGRAR